MHILYIFFLATYCAFAGVVWMITLLLALSEFTRPLAKRLAAGMAGSFAGVFLFQLLCVPVLAVIFLFLNGIAWAGLNQCPPIVSIFFVFLICGIPAAASLRGFYLGWRTAWEWVEGRSPRAFVAADWLLGPMMRCFC